MKAPIIVSLGLFKATGGPVKTISRFREALGAELFCFSDARQLEKEQPAVEGATAVKSVHFPILRQLAYPEKSSLGTLESAAREASLISTHSFYRYHSAWVHTAHKRWGVPYWHVPHGILDPYVLTYGRWGKQAFLKMGGRRFMEDASCTIFATQREWEKAESVFGPLRGEVVHWPVELPDLADKARRRATVRQRLGIPGDARVLLYFGRVQAMKRPLETIDAAASVKSDQLHLLMVGPCEGITPEDLTKRATEKGLKHFHYAGGVFGEEKFDYLFAADAYLSFSIRENFNHTAAESMASGLPVILSQGNDLGPLVEEARAGWYLHEDSATAFKAAVELFLNENESALEARGSAGRALVGDAFSFESFKARLLQMERQYGRS